MIGVAARGGVLRLVEATGRGRSGECLRTAEVDLPAASDRSETERWALASERLQRAVARARFGSAAVAVAMPTSQVWFQRLSLVPMPSSELAEAVRWRAAHNLGQKPSELSTDLYEVGEVLQDGRPMREVIAVSARTADIANVVGLFRDAGLRVVAIDTWIGAVCRFLAQSEPGGDAGGACLVVELDRDINLIALVQGGVPYFIRSYLTRPQDRRPTPNEAAWTSDGPCPPEAAVKQGPSRPDAASAQRATAAVLAHEIALCSHYLTESCQTAVFPRAGCLIGAGVEEERLLLSLNESCTTPLVPWREMASESALESLRRCPPGRDEEGWIAAIGLAQHRDGHAESRRAA